MYCDGTWYERKPLGSGGGGGTSYTAGNGINIADDTISVDTTTIQEKLTAGSNVTISDNTISATDTTYSNFTGTDGTTAGTAGLVPAPATTDADKFLKSDGTWATAGGGGGSVTVVQTTGTSTTDVMSQNAVTSMICSDPSTVRRIQIGDGAQSTNNQAVAIGRDAKAKANYAVALGYKAEATDTESVALGHSAYCPTAYSVAVGVQAGANTPTNVQYSVALGGYSKPTRSGEVNIGTPNYNSHGFNNTDYRVIGGVHDGQELHDAATVAQGNVLATSAPTTSTVGALGQLYTDTTNMHTYQCTAISGDTYTWTQRW